MRIAILVVVVGCGGGQSPDPAPPCTPEGQEVAGEALAFEAVDLGFDGGSIAPTHLITSDAELAAEFGGTPPPALDDVDFTTDRIALGASNPALRFVAQDPQGDLFAGQEPLCQGVPPSVVAYVLRDVTSNALVVLGCPYTGPDPCLAP